MSFVKDLIKNKKITLEQVVFIDFSLYSDEKVDYKTIVSNFKEIYPKEEPFFVFDEVQDIDNFKDLVLSLYNL
jgi:predicted AAA+ superfamily ATPase